MGCPLCSAHLLAPLQQEDCYLGHFLRAAPLYSARSLVDRYRYPDRHYFRFCP